MTEVTEQKPVVTSKDHDIHDITNEMVPYIQDRLLEVTGLKPRKAESPVAFTRRVCVKVAELPDEDWEWLKEPSDAKDEDVRAFETARTQRFVNHVNLVDEEPKFLLQVTSETGEQQQEEVSVTDIGTTTEKTRRPRKSRANSGKVAEAETEQVEKKAKKAKPTKEAKVSKKDAKAAKKTAKPEAKFDETSAKLSTDLSHGELTRRFNALIPAAKKAGIHWAKHHTSAFIDKDTGVKQIKRLEDEIEKAE